MSDDRERTSRPNGSTLLLAVVVPVTVLIGIQQWRLSAELGRLERLVRELDARHNSAIYNALNTQQGLALEVRNQAESLRLKDLAYFPTGAFGKDDDRAALIARHLRGLKADSLWELAGREDAGPAVRLLWLPETGRPTAVRLRPPDRRTGNFTLEAAQVAGPDSDGTGKVVRASVGLLPEHEADLMHRLDEVGLWSAPAALAADPPRSSGGKGLWVLEGVKEGRYHLLAGESADDPAFRNFGRKMLEYCRSTWSRDIRIP